MLINIEGGFRGLGGRLGVSLTLSAFAVAGLSRLLVFVAGKGVGEEGADFEVFFGEVPAGLSERFIGIPVVADTLAGANLYRTSGLVGNAAGLLGGDNEGLILKSLWDVDVTGAVCCFFSGGIARLSGVDAAFRFMPARTLLMCCGAAGVRGGIVLRLDNVVRGGLIILFLANPCAALLPLPINRMLRGEKIVGP